jgi:small basic protein
LILIPIIALLLGAAIATFAIRGPLSGEAAQYLAVACLAGLDTVCGGIRGGLEGKFRSDVFITGFVSNVLIASFLAWLGDKIYLNLFLAVALVLGGRIFTNLSLIRRYMLTKWTDWRERQKLQAKSQQATQVAVQPEPNT